jgi:hypothetical protein
MRMRWMRRISSMTRSKMPRSAALVSGPVHVGEDQLLAFRLVDRQPGFALHPTDVFHHTGPLVEQLNDAAIDFVDVLAQLVQFQARLFFGHALTLVTGDSKPALSWRAKSSRCAARFGSFP